MHSLVEYTPNIFYGPIRGPIGPIADTWRATVLDELSCRQVRSDGLLTLSEYFASINETSKLW